MPTLTINGKATEVAAADDMPLLWALRDVLNLTGTKYGCGVALCGACTVHLDGQPVRACQTLVGDVGTQKITTIEGVSGVVADAVKAAWVENEVPQCGYCQSGQVMSAIALLEGNKSPSDTQIEEAMSGNVCRCATYVRIKDGIRSAAKTLGA
jgi:isoquinoline 1-oxidoreductase subunit alpha